MEAYKILAKTIATRVQPFLPQLIYDSHTGFVQERSIFYNIFLFWEMVAIPEQQQRELAILFLDLEKACDRVDWDFMEGTLLRMGFPVQWIRALAVCIGLLIVLFCLQDLMLAVDFQFHDQ